MSIWNTFDPLADIIKDNINILMTSESKSNDSFLDGQFFLHGLRTPFGTDRNENGGVLCFSLEMTFLQKLFLQVMTGLFTVFT